MNKIKFITRILSLLLICWACKEEIDPYQGESGIYFDTQNTMLDTIFVTWGLKDSEITEQELTLKVCLFGDVMPYNRKFNIRVNADATDTLAAEEGVDFRPINTECVLPANQAEAPITITLLRRSDLAQKPRRFTIRLQESEELKFLYSREIALDSTEWVDDVKARQIDLERTIYMDERFQMPVWWYMYGPNYFGTYSSKKMILICDVLNIDREDFVAPLVPPNKLTAGYLKFAGQYMHRWLQENPQEETDGTPMEMGTESQI